MFMEKKEIIFRKLSPVLQALYKQFDRSDHFCEDVSKLHEAFENVELLWKKQAGSISNIAVVLLAEAPGYGKEEIYFYNPSARATEFFNYLDAETLIGPISAISHKIDGIRPRKARMIGSLTSSGFLIVDLFPFAFKEKETKISFKQLRTQKQYLTLFNETAPLYFIPKLKYLKRKVSGQRPLFLFRYSFLKKELHGAVTSILHDLQLLPEGEQIESIHKGRNVDRERLKKLCTGRLTRLNRSTRQAG